jgi:asparagine synthase (glutamine-hydrolysing)
VNALLAHSTLAGIYDPHASLDTEGGIRAVGRAVEGPEERDVVATAPLTAVRSPRAAWTRPGLPGVFCLLVGRLYNLDELRQEVGVATGVEPEVVVAAAYRRLGPGALERLSGSFALLLWDVEARRGLVAQDQLGMRSVYYCEQGSRLYFASDVAPLLRMLPKTPAPDEVTLVHRLSNSNPPMERTIYVGVRRLTAGHLLELGDKRWSWHRYWEPRYRRPSRRSFEDVRDGLWAAVMSAVHARMGEAENIGIVMSGGIDSLTVATAAMEAARDGRPQPRGYSAVFPGNARIDETDRIQLLADGLGVPSIQIEPRPGGVLPLMLDYMKRWEIPVTGPGYLLERPLLERAAADGVVALLDGQGGNEVFGLSPYLIADRLRRGRVVSSVRLARRLPLAREHPPWRQTMALWRLFGLKGAVPYRLHETARQHRGRFVPRSLAPESARIYAETNDPLSWKRNLSGPLWWAFKSYLLTRGREETSLTEYLRHRAAMVGIEARPPLMDLGLVEFVLSTPPELDFDHRYDRPVIRDSLKGSAPDAVRLDRRKSNLASFYHQGWIEHDLPLVRRVLLAPDVEVRRLVEPGSIAQLLEDPPRVGGRNWMQWGPTIWGLLVVECFLQYLADPSWLDRLLDSPELVAPRSRVVDVRP